jgi:hypothetical protein
LGPERPGLERPALERLGPERFRAIHWAIPLALAALVGLLTVDGGFVFDDWMAIHKNVVVRGELPLSSSFCRGFWGQPVGQGIQSYRPLALWPWRLLWWVGEGSPLPFRIASVLWHGLATLALLVVARRLVSPWVAFGGASLFAIHGARSEAVGALVGQPDMLSAALALAALGCVLGVRRAPRSGFAAAVLLATACLVKESAFALGLVVVLAVLARIDEPRRERGWRAAPSIAVLMGVLAVQLAIPRATGFHNWMNSLAYVAEGLERWGLASWTVGRGLALSFVPIGLSPQHGYAAVDLSAGTLLPLAIPAVIVTAVAAGLGFAALRRGHVPAVVGIAGLFAPLFLQSGLVMPTGTDLAERLLYPAIMASSMLIATGLARLPVRPTVRNGALAALILANAGISVRAQRPWHSAESLWAYAAEATPLSYRARVGAARQAAAHGRLGEAAWHLVLRQHIGQRFPKPVDRAAVAALEELPVRERIAAAPGALAEEPCALVGPVLARTRADAPGAFDAVLSVWSQTHPQCLAPPKPPSPAPR